MPREGLNGVGEGMNANWNGLVGLYDWVERNLIESGRFRRVSVLYKVKPALSSLHILQAGA